MISVGNGSDIDSCWFGDARELVRDSFDDYLAFVCLFIEKESKYSRTGVERKAEVYPSKYLSMQSRCRVECGLSRTFMDLYGLSRSSLHDLTGV